MTAMVQTEAQRRGIRLTLVTITVVVLAFLMLFFNKMLSPRVMSIEDLRLNGAIVFDAPRIIEPFELRHHGGKPFTHEDLRGQWSLIYFGFTHCPDICPTTMAKLAQLVPKLDEEVAKDTQVLLVSVDPARDTEANLKAYLASFDPEFIGVTGEFVDIMRFSRNVNVAFNKVMLEGDDYTIDHTGHLVLINPAGHFHAIFKPPFELAKLKTTFQSIVVSY